MALDLLSRERLPVDIMTVIVEYCVISNNSGSIPNGVTDFERMREVGKVYESGITDNR